MTESVSKLLGTRSWNVIKLQCEDLDVSINARIETFKRHLKLPVQIVKAELSSHDGIIIRFTVQLRRKPYAFYAIFFDKQDFVLLSSIKKPFSSTVCGALMSAFGARSYKYLLLTSKNVDSIYESCCRENDVTVKRARIRPPPIAKPCDPGAMVAPVSSDVIVQQDDDGERASRLVSYLKAQDGPQFEKCKINFSDKFEVPVGGANRMFTLTDDISYAVVLQGSDVQKGMSELVAAGLASSKILNILSEAPATTVYVSRGRRIEPPDG